MIKVLISGVFQLDCEPFCFMDANSLTCSAARLNDNHSDIS